MLPVEPPHQLRAIAFFDGQNLFHAARSAFGYTYPNCNPKRLAATIYNVAATRDVVTRATAQRSFRVTALTCQ